MKTSHFYYVTFDKPNEFDAKTGSRDIVIEKTWYGLKIYYRLGTKFGSSSFMLFAFVFADLPSKVDVVISPHFFPSLMWMALKYGILFCMLGWCLSTIDDGLELFLASLILSTLNVVFISVLLMIMEHMISKMEFGLTNKEKDQFVAILQRSGCRKISEKRISWLNSFLHLCWLYLRALRKNIIVAKDKGN